MKTSDISNDVVLDAYVDAFHQRTSVEALLVERSGAPIKVVRSAMTRAFRAGLVTTDRPRIGFDYVTPAKNELAIAFCSGQFAMTTKPKD